MKADFQATLRPQLFIRNIIGKSVNAALRFNWRAGATTGKAFGPQLHLAPHETRRVDVAALQDGTTLPKQANWTSVTLTTKTLPSEVMVVAASYDETLRYGAQTPFSDQLSFKWEGGMWEFGPYHSSIITAGNGGTKATQAAFTIFYNQGTQKYELEQTLQPDEQMWIDVGKLIRERVPDKDGNTLPQNLASGSYEFRDLTNRAVGTLFEGKVIYDKTYGHVAYGCALCCGFLKPGTLWSDPLGVPFGAGAPNGVNVYDNCGGYWLDGSDSFYNSWNTANHAIATADYYGTHTGVSVGSTTNVTYGFMQAQDNRNDCPNEQFHPPQGGVNVQPCPVPASEATAVEAAVFTTNTAFNQYISDALGDRFDGSTVEEGNAAPGQDTCWGSWSTGPRVTGVPTNPPSTWTVAGGQVVGQPNHWGFDYVGWSQAAVDYYRVQAPAHGVAIPCGFTAYQSMQIQCPNGGWRTYTPSVGNKLTATIEQTDVINCRYDMNNSACQTIHY